MSTEVSEKKCSIDGCKHPYRAKGYCENHYKKWRHGGLPKPRYKICVAEGCRKKRTPSGLCEEHQKAKDQAAVPAVEAPAPATEAVPAPAGPPPSTEPTPPETPSAA